uniref:Uncharacterized protein n=1 Tax=Psilocybe cubensis TaxID=181762 RepID=A0A8H7XTG9_PSICU
MESKVTPPDAQLAVSGGRSLCKLLVENEHERVRQLLEISPDLINTRHPLGWAPLHTATLNCDPELLAFILSLPGLDVSVKDQSTFNTSSSDADIQCRKEELCPKIVGTESTAGASALHFACMRGDAAVLDLYIGSTTDISKGFDWQDEKKRLPREYFDLARVDIEVVRAYHEATVQWRMRYRSLERKVGSRTQIYVINVDSAALCRAICERDLEYCKEIINSNKSLAITRSRGIYGRISSIIKSLKPASIDLHSITSANPYSDDDSQPLHLACLVGEMSVVELILQAGGDWERKDDNNMLPEEYVKVHGSVRMEEFRALCAEEKERRDKKVQQRKAEEAKEKEAKEKEEKRKLDEQLEALVCMGELMDDLQHERERDLEGLSDEKARKRAERASKAQKRCNKAERKKTAKAEKEKKRKQIAEDKYRMRHLEIERSIGANVVGQRGPIRSIASALRLRENGWVDPERPLVLMFLGSSGIGKTEIAKRIALYLHNDALKTAVRDKANGRSSRDNDSESGDDSDEDGNNNRDASKDGGKEGKKERKITLRDIEKSGTFVRIDMSEYQHSHTVANLTGSPKGYVGYEGGGNLTNQLRKNPRAVVLFDEIEKAHPDVLTVFLQLFDDARITDPKHGTIHCPDAVFIMTSNLGSEEIRQAAPGLHKLVERTEAVDMHTQYLNGIANFNKTLYPVLKKTLKRDEFLGRINQMVVFLPFTENEIRKIVRVELDKWKKRAHEHHGIRLSWTPEVIAKLAQGYDENYGARSVSNEVKSCAIQVIAESQIRGNIKKNCNVRLVINDTGNIDLRREDPHVAAPPSDSISAGDTAA